MNKFNKLYNLILLSIITEDINSKIKKAIDTLIKSGLLKDLNDPRAEQVKTIIKRNNSIDINGKTKLDLLLKQNEQYINRAEVAKDNYLDSIPEFSLKKLYPNGVVIYKVEDSEAGMRAVRKVVDAQWGYDANPWCLIARNASAWDYWQKYNGYPKHIAFQNGLLLAFCANNDEQNLWWDRKDHKSKKLKLLDGSLFKTPKYLSNEQLKIKRFITKQKSGKLIYNELTGLYNVNGDINILNSDLINGHYPIKFNIVFGNFTTWYCKSLKSLEGAPRKVSGDFKCPNCTNLTSLEGGPKEVGGDFRCYRCSKLINLIGAPKFVGGNFDCMDCTSLISLLGAPEEVRGGFDCAACESLKTLLFAPKKVGGDFYCQQCYSLLSLIGMPKIIKGNFNCYDCNKLKSLLGGPEEVGGWINVYLCHSLKNLVGAPKKVGDWFNISNCSGLISLKGAPLGDNVGNYIQYNDECTNLKITSQDKEKYKLKETD